MKMSRIAILGVVILISAIAAKQAYAYAPPPQYAWGQMTMGNGCGHMNGQGMTMGQEVMGNVNGDMMNQNQMMYGSDQQHYVNGNQMPTQQCQAMHQ